MPSREEPDFQNVIPVGVADVRVDEFRAFGAGGAFGNDEGFVGFFVADEPVLEGGRLDGGRLAAEGAVGLLDIAVAEHRREPLQGLGGLGEEADAAHGPVKPVGDAHKDLAGLVVPPGDEGLEGFGEGFVAGLVALHDLSRLLVEGQDVVVLGENPAGDVSHFRI